MLNQLKIYHKNNMNNIAYKLSYALKRGGDNVVRCGWCDKPVSEIDNLGEHLTKHEKEDQKKKGKKHGRNN